MSLSPEEIAAIFLTLKLATVSIFLLLLIGTPCAYWLANTKSPLKGPVASIVALPLVLPPTVIGFYLLIAMRPDGFLGAAIDSVGLPQLAFSFYGLVLGSIIYSMPFVVHPLQNAFEAIDPKLKEASMTLGAGPFDRFLSITLPLSKRGFLTAVILGFAHTVGEFGVVLMIGGNVPGETQVLSVLLYEQVESFNYARANTLALMLLAFSFAVLLALYCSRNGSSFLTPPTTTARKTNTTDRQ